MTTNEYLRVVKRCAEQALVQKRKVTPCEHHKEVLLHNGDETYLYVVRNLATIWIKGGEAGIAFVLPQDVDDAIREVLDGAARDGCPKCGLPEDI